MEIMSNESGIQSDDILKIKWLLGKCLDCYEDCYEC